MQFRVRAGSAAGVLGSGVLVLVSMPAVLVASRQSAKVDAAGVGRRAVGVGTVKVVSKIIRKSVN